MKSPVRYFGGKSAMSKNILPLIPPHKVYSETFAGAAYILLAKTPSEKEVLNDKDTFVINFFRVMRDQVMFEELERRLHLTPFGREELELARTEPYGYNGDRDPVEIARRFYIRCNISFSALQWQTGSWSGVGLCHANLPPFRTKVLGLREISERLLWTHIECQTWEKNLDIYDSPDTFFYLDPPYIQESRAGTNEYLCDMYEEEEHVALVDALLEIKGKVILSGYPSGVYDRLEAQGWRVRRFETVCQAAAKTRSSGLQGAGNVLEKQKRTEVLWISPNCETIKDIWET